MDSAVVELMQSLFISAAGFSGIEPDQLIIARPQPEEKDTGIDEPVGHRPLPQ